MLRCATFGVRKSYGENAILCGIDLAIAEGGFAVLVGPSGCGKSTLLRTVAGLEAVDSGRIELGGRDVTALEPRERDIAMVFQSYALYPHMSVRDNLGFGLKLRNTQSAEANARIAEASEMLALGPLLDRLPKELSGGQRQRVAMGRAVVRRAQLYLFDEPLSNLDAALRADVRVQIRALHDRLGMTTLYVTHDQVEAMTLADELWVLNQGRVEQRGAPLDVYDFPDTQFVAGFLGSPHMNFLPATIELGANGEACARVHTAGTCVKLPTRTASALAADGAGRAVVLGIRPQHLRVQARHEEFVGPSDLSGAAEARSEADESTFTAVAELVEQLGAEAFMHTRNGAHHWVAQTPPADGRTRKRGDLVTLTARREHVHVFDSISGRSLLPRT